MGEEVNKKKYKTVIIIDGESAYDLFAVGPEDLKNHFFPEGLGINPDDVRQIYMSEDMTPDEFGEVMSGTRESFKHSDNYLRDDGVEGCLE